MPYREKSRYLGSELLRPVFACDRSRELEEALRSVRLPTIPKLLLASHFLFGFVKKPFLLYGDNGIRVTHGEQHLLLSVSASNRCSAVPSAVGPPGPSTWR